jgi:flagellar hook-length control protein FliK
MARSLLTMEQVHHERPPVFSVTSDAVANVSFQGATSRPARPDRPQGNDSFEALVGNSTPAETDNNRAASTEPSASQRRSDDASATADNRASRDATASDRATRDQAASDQADQHDDGARQSSDASADVNINAVARNDAKSSTAKTNAEKSNAKTSSDAASATDALIVASASVLPDTPAAAPQNAVAAAIPVPVALIDVPAVAPASGNATAPLAIAAAAIAASSSVGSATPAANTDSSAAAELTASAAAAASPSDTTAPAKVDPEAAANRPATPTGSTQMIDLTMSTAVAATVPVTSKATPLKAAAAETKTSAEQDLSPGDAPTSAAAADNPLAQPAAAAVRQNAGKDVAGAAKADASAGLPSTPAANASVHEHPAVIDARHTPADSSGAAPQVSSFQPQLDSTLRAAAPAAPLTVTAVTAGAVPLSGLALEIAVSAQSGKSRFEIRLDPADLGRIDVRIDVDRNGQVTSHLRVEKPETLSMLRQDAPQLQRALDDAGFKTGSGGLQFSLRDQSSSGQNNGNETGRNAQRLVISEENTLVPAIAGRTYGRMQGSSSGVDIRV